MHYAPTVSGKSVRIFNLFSSYLAGSYLAGSFCRYYKITPQPDAIQIFKNNS
jgi:hypothetical protein